MNRLNQFFVAGLAMFVFGLTAESTVRAQTTQFQGVDMFVTGDDPAYGGFSPGHDAAFQLVDDGTNGDVTGGDGVYSVDLVTTGNGAYLAWKAASAGFGVEVPGSFQSSRYPAQQGQTVKYIMDTNNTSDGFTPAVDGTSILGYVYTIPSALDGVTTLSLTGNFQDDLGIGGEFAAGDTSPLAFNDSGVNGDAAAGDGIWSVSFTGLSAGTYEALIISDLNFDQPIIRSNGSIDNGNNISFDVFEASDTITFELIRATQRYRISNDNPLVNPGPPFYGTSAAWSTTLGPDTILFDDGTNGDVTAGDGIHSRIFRVDDGPTSGAIKIRQGVGLSFPDTGEGYPFVTTLASQNVLVQFDTNTYTDGFSPATNIVFTDPASRRSFDYVQAFGSFQADFGAVGNFDNNNPFFELLDDGTSGDVAAGDGIYAKTFSNPAVNGVNYKSIAPQGSFQFQFGGLNNGLTVNGNNPETEFDFPANATLVTDAVLGRVGIGTSLPQRPATIDAQVPVPNAARAWQLFE